jgi:hypothetical protein
MQAARNILAVMINETAGLDQRLRFDRGLIVPCDGPLPSRLLIVHRGGRLSYIGWIRGGKTVLESPVKRLFCLAPLLLPKFLAGFLTPLFLDLILGHALVRNAHSILLMELIIPITR